MKKIFGLILSAAVLGTVLTACGGSGASEPASVSGSAVNSSVYGTTLADIQAKGELVIGLDDTFAPMGFRDESGNLVGFDIDLATAVCEELGVKATFQPIDWDAKEMELSSGNIDCIWNGFTMNGREDDYTWSEPYVDNSQVFVVKEDSGIASFDDLAGKTVAVQTDSSAQAALDEDENADLKNSFKELLVVGDYNTAFMNLEAGAVDAIAMDIGVANYQLESRSGGFTILDEPLAAEQYAIGFKKGNTELRDKVQKTLDEMAADGTFEKIAEKWDLQDSVTLGK